MHWEVLKWTCSKTDSMRSEIVMKKSQVILVENVYWKNAHTRPTSTKKFKKCVSMGKNYQG